MSRQYGGQHLARKGAAHTLCGKPVAKFRYLVLFVEWLCKSCAETTEYKERYESHRDDYDCIMMRFGE